MRFDTINPHLHLPAGFVELELSASWPCADRAPDFEPVPPPTPAAERPVLDRSSQERTSHPQSVLCHRERGTIGWIEDVFMEGEGREGRWKWVRRKDGGMIEYILEDRMAEMERREECDGKDGGGGEIGDEALLTQKRIFKHREHPNGESNNRDRL